MRWRSCRAFARRGRIEEYAATYKTATYVPVDRALDHNPLWSHKAHCAFPCATQNEVNGKDAQNLLQGRIAKISAQQPSSHCATSRRAAAARSSAAGCSGERSARATPD